MTDNPPPAIQRLIEIFGLQNLALILEDYELIQAKSGHGEITLVIYDGKTKGIEVTLKHKLLRSD